MFGGIAFMLAGDMAVGVIGGDLMVRLDPADAEKALAETHTRPMDFTGRPSKSMVYVDAEGVKSDENAGGGAARGEGRWGLSPLWTYGPQKRHGRCAPSSNSG